MPEEKRRIIIEKSSTVRRRAQRSNKVFKFTAEQLKRIEREEAREKRARDLREKDKKRIANKKKKAEEDAKLREEQRRHGPPDPDSLKFPSSQQLLSKFMGFAKPQQPKQPQPKPQSEVTAETSDNDKDKDASADGDSGGGDTEVDSDEFDDLDEELEQELSTLENKGPLQIHEPENLTNDTPIEASKETKEPEHIEDDDDEFSDCSVFDDEDLLNQANQAEKLTTPKPSIAEAGKLSLKSNPVHPRRQPAAEQPKPPPILSLGDSFHDETGDYIDDIFKRGSGDSFSELLHMF